MHAGWLLPRVGTIACQSQFGSSNTSKRVPPKWSSWVIPVIGDDGFLSGTTVVQTSTRRNHGISSPICHPTLTCSSQADCLKFQVTLADELSIQGSLILSSKNVRPRSGSWIGVLRHWSKLPSLLRRKSVEVQTKPTVMSVIHTYFAPKYFTSTSLYSRFLRCNIDFYCFDNVSLSFAVSLLIILRPPSVFPPTS